MKAIIMAAGLGNRLGELTRDRPKALVPVLGRELILRAMDFIADELVTEKIVVTGFEGERLARFVSSRCDGVKILHNPNFRDGSIRTIQTALPAVDGDFLLMNVDHIYPRRLFKRLVSGVKGITAICDFDRKLGADDMKIKLTPAGTLAGMSKALSDFDGGYIGMTFCPGKMLDEYRQAVAEARSAAGDAASVEAALAHLATTSTPVDICDVSGIPWLEVDTQEELQQAEKTLNGNPDFLK